MRKYRSRAPKGRRNEGLEAALWIIFAPFALIAVVLKWLKNK